MLAAANEEVLSDLSLSGRLLKNVEPKTPRRRQVRDSVPRRPQESVDWIVQGVSTVAPDVTQHRGAMSHPETSN